MTSGTVQVEEEREGVQRRLSIDVAKAKTGRPRVSRPGKGTRRRSGSKADRPTRNVAIGLWMPSQDMCALAHFLLQAHSIVRRAWQVKLLSPAELQYPKTAWPTVALMVSAPAAA
jgi:hypothetical protein